MVLHNTISKCTLFLKAYNTAQCHDAQFIVLLIQSSAKAAEFSVNSTNLSRNFFIPFFSVDRRLSLVPNSGKFQLPICLGEFELLLGLCDAATPTRRQHREEKREDVRTTERTTCVLCGKSKIDVGVIVSLF